MINLYLRTDVYGLIRNRDCNFCLASIGCREQQVWPPLSLDFNSKCFFLAFAARRSPRHRTFCKPTRRNFARATFSTSKKLRARERPSCWPCFFSRCSGWAWARRPFILWGSPTSTTMSLVKRVLFISVIHHLQIASEPRLSYLSTNINRV